MSFSTGYLADPKKSGSGEFYGDNCTILSASTFENGLKVGLFAKLDAGSLDNLDASATPVIAGVVLRSVTTAVEDGDTIDLDYRSYAEYLRSGLVSVQAKSGESPTFGAAVFAYNVADANIGKATLVDSAATEPTNAEFVEVLDAVNNIWLVRLK
jgi:hypothetical protein